MKDRILFDCIQHDFNGKIYLVFSKNHNQDSYCEYNIPVLVSGKLDIKEQEFKEFFEV